MKTNAYRFTGKPSVSTEATFTKLQLGKLQIQDLMYCSKRCYLTAPSYSRKTVQFCMVQETIAQTKTAAHASAHNKLQLTIMHWFPLTPLQSIHHKYWQIPATTSMEENHASETRKLHVLKSWFLNMNFLSI